MLQELQCPKDLLGFHHCRHPNHQHQGLHHCHDPMGQFHSNHRISLINRKFHHYHRLNHLDHLCHHYRGLLYWILQGISNKFRKVLQSLKGHVLLRRRLQNLSTLCHEVLDVVEVVSDRLCSLMILDQMAVDLVRHLLYQVIHL